RNNITYKKGSPAPQTFAVSFSFHDGKKDNQRLGWTHLYVIDFTQLSHQPQASRQSFSPPFTMFHRHYDQKCLNLIR
ncbi:hypothetical protein, partial [Burkholderia multivorans]|uniref:hypothetical protein n=1 Tax=Burkholderia multivorans TaxID=87883 RepID=UPI0021BF1CDD